MQAWLQGILSRLRPDRNVAREDFAGLAAAAVAAGVSLKQQHYCSVAQKHETRNPVFDPEPWTEEADMEQKVQPFAAAGRIDLADGALERFEEGSGRFVPL